MMKSLALREVHTEQNSPVINPHDEWSKWALIQKDSSNLHTFVAEHLEKTTKKNTNCHSITIYSPIQHFRRADAHTHMHHHIHTPRTGTVSTPSSHHVHYCTHHGYICLANHIPKPDKVKGSFISPQYLAMEPNKERKLAFQE